MKRLGDPVESGVVSSARLGEDSSARAAQFGQSGLLSTPRLLEIADRFAGHQALLSIEQTVARVEQEVDCPTLLSGELIDRPGGQGRLPSLLDLRGVLTLARLTQFASELIASGNEGVEFHRV